MIEPFLGMVVMYGCNFAPRGWMFCNGQLLPIAQNTALFSLLGTQYGGNGQTTFALPDLRGRMPIGHGQGPGLTLRSIGETAGTENVTLVAAQMPQHNHAFNVNNTSTAVHVPTASSIIGAATDINGDASNAYNAAVPNVTLALDSINNIGGSQSHNNMMPYLAVNYCIAIQGIFPSRN